MVAGDERVLLPTPTLGHIRNYDEEIDDYLGRRQDYHDGKVKGMPGISLGVAVRMELFRTPTTTNATAGAVSEKAALERGTTVKTQDQIAQLAFENGLKVSDSITEQLTLLPTPNARDPKDGIAPRVRDGEVQTDTIARAILHSGEIIETNWGKFAPAIERWEKVIGRKAPAPTKADGKDGSHRLSSLFTEWLMGLPEGWITGHNLSRAEELKMAGNGVVPQQAELALRFLIDDKNFV